MVDSVTWLRQKQARERRSRQLAFSDVLRPEMPTSILEAIEQCGKAGAIAAAFNPFFIQQGLAERLFRRKRRDAARVELTEAGQAALRKRADMVKG